jgi:fatty acid synthase, animal type
MNRNNLSVAVLGISGRFPRARSMKICDNGSDSTTISGPAESVETFVKKMQNEKKMAKQVASSNVAFHSRYIVKMAESFKKSLQQFIANPKKISSK